MHVITARGDARPTDTTDGATVRIVRDNIRKEIVTGEDGPREEYVYTEYRLTPAEYTLLEQGKLTEWNAPLHSIYRRHLHRKTDDLYAMAQRMVRDGADKTAWEDYMKALDDWNRAVSAMATGFSTAEPPLPAQPGR
jgi:hypothetical protein